MRSLRDPEARRDIVARLSTVTTDSPRQWGRMEPSQMLAHVADQLRMAVGGVEVKKARGPMRFRPIRYLVVHHLPWPKGKSAAPREAFTSAPTDFETDRATLMALIDRFATLPGSELKPLHPLFGNMTEYDWGVLSYRHLDHHLRQFGA